MRTVSTEANDFFAEVHNKRKRMPLVLDEFYLDEWLMDDLGEPDLNELMAVGFTRKEFAAHPVTRNLYKRGFETNVPEILNPVEKNTLF